ncbi:MAG: DNA mismatch repair protein MutS [Anabaena sp. 49633_E8]|nr:DNA mismatch repair protein MutS [Anabaena sp. 49633_E8]
MTTSTPEPNQPNKSLTDTNLVEDRSKLSKMYQHYVEVKDKYPHALLLYRVGDFFETFFQDAVTVSRELELVLTSKHGGEVGRVAMTGVPHHAWERYTTQLVEKGYAVVICDQVEDSADAIGLVKREVTRILTPGTLLEEGMLKASRNNYIAAVVIAVNHWGLAYADISTGEFLTSQGSDLEHLTQELMRLQPSEVLFPTNAPDLGSLLRPGETSPSLPQCLPPTFCYSLRSQVPFSQAEARSKLLQKFKVRSLEGLGCEHLPLAVRAAGGLLEYIEDTQKANPVSLQLLRTYTLNDYLIVDHQTRRNLEITQTVRDGTFHGSLLWALDRTSTAMGSRALRRWLLQPLLEIKGIKSRQDTIQELVENTPLRQDLRHLLKQIYDLERLTVRAASGRANARDLVALADSFSRLPELSRLVEDARSPFLKALQKVPPSLEELAEKLHAHIVESPPTHLKEGGLIRAGINPLLDERKATVESDQQWIANLEVDERTRTGIPTLKVGFNKTFGYYISISRSKSDQVPDNYIRKQTLTNEERYITPDLKEREARILTARDDLNQLEYEIFDALRDEVGSHAEIIRNIARAVAASDVLCGLAELAVHQGYCRPEMLTGREINVIDGRHPVVEQSLPAGFRIFTRVGAVDDLATGQSTFMVEMNETANILNHATAKSLVLLDEIGRGTATFDGLSIAWAVAEYLAVEIKSRTIFATHYHELNELATIISNVANYQVTVKELPDQIIFLHQVQPGGADKSYGIEAGRLAGLPTVVIQRAKQVMGQIEKHSKIAMGLRENL